MYDGLMLRTKVEGQIGKNRFFMYIKIALTYFLEGVRSSYPSAMLRAQSIVYTQQVFGPNGKV